MCKRVRLASDVRGTAGSVAYGVAYGPFIAHIPAVLSVAVVRLGHTSLFQDRSVRPLRHLSALTGTITWRDIVGVRSHAREPVRQEGYQSPSARSSEV